jgi:hypothetical protein
MRNFHGSDSPYYFGGGAALYCGGHGASCKLSTRGTCYRCYPVLSSTTVVACSGAEAVVVGVAAVKAIALGVHALADEGFLLLATTLLGLLFLIQTIVA